MKHANFVIALAVVSSAFLFQGCSGGSGNTSNLTALQALTEWNRIAKETRAVLGSAIERMGTTFSTFRTLWNEPGSYADQLRVYDRAGEPCRNCAAPIRRIVQGPCYLGEFGKTERSLEQHAEVQPRLPVHACENRRRDRIRVEADPLV